MLTTGNTITRIKSELKVTILPTRKRKKEESIVKSGERKIERSGISICLKGIIEKRKKKER
jgi:hypothetical protein